MMTMTLMEAARLLSGTLSGDNARFTAVSTDTRTLRPGDLFVALKGPNFDGHDFVAAARERGACAALVSQAQTTDLPQLLVADTRLALGRLGQAWRTRFKGPLVALTGSNGKTTVKEMIAAILRKRGKVLATTGNLNNDIGVPLTLMRLQEEYDYAVIEMGANHIGEIAYLTQLAQPDVAVITNAGPAHLEGFGGLDGVARGKGEIFQGLGPDGVAIINHDDRYANYWFELAQGRRIIDFGLNRPARVSARILNETSNRFRLFAQAQEVDIELPLPGRHNVHNALAATAASLAVGIDLEEVRSGLQTMHGVLGRLQRLPGRFGITVIDDTYNANPASLEVALAAVSASPGSKWLVLGDMGELGADSTLLHEQAGRQARAAGFQRLYALGKDSLQAARAFGSGGVHYPTAEALSQALLDSLDESHEKPTSILVKGSRSMRMERIMRCLVDKRPSSTEGAPY